MIKYIIILSLVVFTGCALCTEYTNQVISAGQTIVEYHKQYITNDKGLTPEEKKTMMDACDEYIRLLKND